MWEIIAILLGGLVVGAMARLALPGRQPLGCIGTIAVGVVGGVLGGLVGDQVFGTAESRPFVGFLFSVIGAVLVLLVLEAIRRR